MIRLEGFPPVDIRILPSSATDKRSTLAYLPLPLQNTGKDLTERHKSHSNLDETGSEWETVAPSEELYEQRPEVGEIQLKRQRNFELGSYVHRTINSATTSSSLACRRNTILGPPDIPLPKLPGGVSRGNLAPYPSFYSLSSCYSDLDTNEEIVEEQLLNLEAWDPVRSDSRRRPATMGFGGSLRGDQWMGRRISKISSSTSGDPFQYDGVVYSAFLKPAAECEISNSLHQSTMNHHACSDINDPPKIEAIPQNGIRPSTGNSFYNPAAIQST